ncbi:MAG: hypothetical protein IT183_07680 [Acidobacteria bacterium]|nr:hypothetical protein [Acidobacteriota bacterium]
MTLSCCLRFGGRRLTLPILVALIVARSPSADIRAQAPPPAADVDRAEAAWRAVAPANYSITLVVRVLYPGAGQPVTFRVTGDTPEVVGPPIDRQLLAFYERYSTVDRLFDVIRTTASEQPARRNIEFHPTLGYPRSIDIDPRRDVLHDEIFVQVLDLRTDAPLPGQSTQGRIPTGPGQRMPPAVPAGPPPEAISSSSAVNVPMTMEIRNGAVSEFVAAVPAVDVDGRCESFPVRFGPGQRALFYGFGPQVRPTRRIMIVLDEGGDVVRYSDGRGDLRAPMDPSVSVRDPLGPRTSISIDWINKRGVFVNTQGTMPSTGIRAEGPDVLVAGNLGSPTLMVTIIRARCETR